MSAACKPAIPSHSGVAPAPGTLFVITSEGRDCSAISAVIHTCSGRLSQRHTARIHWPPAAMAPAVCSDAPAVPQESRGRPSVCDAHPPVVTLSSPSEQRVCGLEPTPVADPPQITPSADVSLEEPHSWAGALCALPLVMLSISRGVRALEHSIGVSKQLQSRISNLVADFLEDLEAELPHIHPPPFAHCGQWDLVAGPLGVLPTQHCLVGAATAAGLRRATSLRSPSKGRRVRWLDETQGGALAAVRLFDPSDRDACGTQAAAAGCDVGSCALQ
eukprot:TRINITY_DN11571_c0_g3_i1.p1 TRINITY_DN11571_c0_g3~~TRINITY_DN11571_c0_g3_i1.p1  ORF type:complete len:275 (-),score=-34.28 TRINITY_DN11571_c0_g3_i1:445-1269(-)